MQKKRAYAYGVSFFYEHGINGDTCVIDDCAIIFEFYSNKQLIYLISYKRWEN